MIINKLKYIFYKRTNTKEINIKEVEEMIKQDKSVILLDVRSPQEFNEMHLNNAILIPLYELEAKAESIILNKDNIIIVYCKSGFRSIKAIKILQRLGYKNIYHLKGGLDCNL